MSAIWVALAVVGLMLLDDSEPTVEKAVSKEPEVQQKPQAVSPSVETRPSPDPSPLRGALLSPAPESVPMTESQASKL